MSVISAEPLTGAGTPHRAGRRIAACFIGALVLLVACIALRQLASFDPDEPRRAPIIHDSTQTAAVLLHDGTSAWRIVTRRHDAGECLWSMGWLKLNGQTDFRLSSLTTLAVQCGALALLLAAVAQTLRVRWVVIIGLAAAAAVFVPALQGVRPLEGGGAPGVSGMILLSFAHLLVSARAQPGTSRAWLGAVIGALNVLWSSAGVASAAALAIWHGRERRGRALGLDAGVLIAGLALVILRLPSTPASGASFLSSWGALLAGPFTHRALAVVVCAPALVSIGRWIRERSPEPFALATLPALWALLAAAGLAVSGGDVAAAGEFELAILVINAACLVAGIPRRASSPGLAFVLGAGWAIVIADALIHANVVPPETPVVAIGKVRVAGTSELPPAQTRAPLDLRHEKADTDGAFAPDRAPEIPGRGRLPVVGSWSRQGGASTGDFVSAPLRTSLPFVQFRVAGTLRPPDTTLRLRTASGKEIAPLETNFAATGRWKRVNFVPPDEPFQVVAHDASATDWFAFTAPVEFGTWSRIAGKIPGLWPVLLIGGVLLAGLAATGWREFASGSEETTDTGATIRRIAPWLALFGYAVFFSHHVDPTAGPNDSGGYLNSAKLLVGGSITAAPRIPAGIDIDRDPTLYMPITFHAKDGRLVPEYPVGFPLEVWALAHVMPFARAVYWLELGQLVLGVVFTHRLARAFGLGRGAAWFAGGVIGLSPVYLFQALQPQSDGPALVWVTAAVGWAWTSRDKPWHAILAGLATALAVLLRPSNVLGIFPVFACLVGRGGWRRLIYCGLAGLPLGGWLLWYQQQLYGSWHTTGYGDVSTSFGWHFLPPTLRSYAMWLPEMFTPIVVLALIAPFMPSIAARARVVLSIWAGAFVAFYAVYWCTWDNWYNMRFVMPAAPAMVVLGLLAGRAMVGWIRTRRPGVAAWLGHPRVAGVAGLLLLGFLAVRSASRDVTYWLHNNHEHEFAVGWLRDHVPADAVVFAKHATGSIMHYTNLPFIRTDHEKVRESAPLFDLLERAGRPIYAMTYHWETAGYDWKARGSGYPNLPGSWERVALLWDSDVMIWKRRPTGAASSTPAR